MIKSSARITISLAVLLISPTISARQPSATAASAQNPQMTRLAKLLSGDWDTAEEMEQSELHPGGTGRHGRSYCGLEVDGAVLVCRGASDGSAGKLRYMISFWWDQGAGIYRLLTCFNDPKNPCELRGTAHWEGNDFVNEYDETVDGKRVKAWDTFTQTSPTTRKLVWSRDAGNGKRKVMVTSTSTRRSGE